MYLIKIQKLTMSSIPRMSRKQNELNKTNKKEIKIIEKQQIILKNLPPTFAVLIFFEHSFDKIHCFLWLIDGTV